MKTYKEKFESLEEEFQYYAMKMLFAERKNDRESYLAYLKKAKDLLERIENKEKK